MIDNTYACFLTLQCIKAACLLLLYPDLTPRIVPIVPRLFRPLSIALQNRRRRPSHVAFFCFLVVLRPRHSCTLSLSIHHFFLGYLPLRLIPRRECAGPGCALLSRRARATISVITADASHFHICCPMDQWQEEPPVPAMDTDIETTDEGSSISAGPPRASDWSCAPIFHATTKHPLADIASDIISRIQVRDPVVEIPTQSEVKYVIQPMFGTKHEEHPLQSVRQAQEWRNLLNDYPTNMRPLKGDHKRGRAGQGDARYRSAEVPKLDVPIADGSRYELGWMKPSESMTPDHSGDLESEDDDEDEDDYDSDDYMPGGQRYKRKGRGDPNPFREKEGRYQARSFNIRFADVPLSERRIVKENASFAARKALLAQTHQGLKIQPIGGNIARVTMCGFMKPGDPMMTCGIYTTKTYDLIRHRVAHLYYECLMSELDEVPVGGGLVFGGFHVELPTCSTCGKTFTRYDSLQRHGKRTDTACFAPNLGRYSSERENRERRLEVVRRELEKNVGMQYWIRAPQPLPKTVKARVGIRNGGPGLGSCVLEILAVEETYAAKYEFTTVKDGKELQVRLLDHNETGGIPFYRPMKGSYDPNPNGKGLVLPP
ncbi:hypothetical protein CALVIDRAFT_259185 [Calocera viscosa TUFC12733]|uniref:C2H2-type domain-containing protein n=1 Tax=Calocera viscosa (strain TUFC12733) TaxID=1330018 RepID=A0A167J302_CALVF|nr:hypothetical protein CALVIDRAFT_259185 [Calocera viscosa TUFC12733]